MAFQIKYINLKLPLFTLSINHTLIIRVIKFAKKIGHAYGFILLTWLKQGSSTEAGRNRRRKSLSLV